MGLVNETVHAFNSEYNLGNDKAKSLMPFCRPVVEKYVFSKLYDKLFAMYAHKNEVDDRLFVERSSLIKQKRPEEVMNYLGINKKFLLTSHGGRPSGMESMMTEHQENPFRVEAEQSKDHLHFGDLSSQYDSHRSLANTLPLPGVRGDSLPYLEAIKCIERIQTYQSPRDKLKSIGESFACLKTAIVDHWKGKVELQTMDDVLPLTIYVVAMADLSHPASEYNIMDDYLRVYDKGFEYEKKLLTNFDVSIRYVNSEWEL